LIGDEFVEVGVGEPAPHALRAFADDDVAEIARGDVGVERLDRATEPGSGLRGGLEPVRWGVARLALAAGRRGSRDNCPCLGRLHFLSEQCLEAPRQAGAAIRRLRFLLGLAVAPMVRNEDPGTYWYFYDIGEFGHRRPSEALLDQASTR